MADAAILELVGSKTLHNPANASLLAYCPSMELVAVGTQDKHVFIFRINGQRVYGAGQKQKYTVLDAQKLAWKPNGEHACVYRRGAPTDMPQDNFWHRHGATARSDFLIRRATRSPIKFWFQKEAIKHQKSRA